MKTKDIVMLIGLVVVFVGLFMLNTILGMICLGCYTVAIGMCWDK